MLGILEDWEGKADGTLQIIFEQGFLSSSKIVNRELLKIMEHTVEGRNDDFGDLLPETSVKHLNAQLSDFQDKEILLQYHGRCAWKGRWTKCQSVIPKWLVKESSTTGWQWKDSSLLATIWKKIKIKINLVRLCLGFFDKISILWQDFHMWINGDELVRHLKEIRNLRLNAWPTLR